MCRENQRSSAITSFESFHDSKTDPEEQIVSIVVMGVSGAGKSTVGNMLASQLGFTFCDADGLHPPENVERMASGHPLGDTDRWPWLEAVGQYLADSRKVHRGTVMACSALKHSYRDVLRNHVPDVFFVFLDGPMSIVRDRINDRNHEFMPATLLASQYASLEPLSEAERGIRIDIAETPARIVSAVTSAMAAASMPQKLWDR